MMNYHDTNYFNGFLVERLGSFITRDDLLSSTNMKFIGEIDQSQWEELELYSEIPLRREDTELIKKPYIYPVISRRSGTRVILMSYTRKMIEHVLNVDLSDIFYPKPRYVPIAVDELVKSITRHPTIYTLSFVHARIPAFGTSLRSASFYGDDLGDASLFSENVALMNCFVCGLRPAKGGPEIVRLGTDGSISFYMTSPQKVREVENVLMYLRKEGYLSTQIWEEG